MEVLETLIIDCNTTYEDNDIDTRKMDFSQLVMACPATLTTLSIGGLDLTFNTVPSSTTSIKHLTLKHVGLTPALAKCIESCFPKLSILHLQATLTTSATVVLQDCHLESVNTVLEYNDHAASNTFSTETACHGGISYHTITQTQIKTRFSQFQ
jgi:hypothetical protein